MIDIADWLVAAGLLLLGGAMYLATGWVGVLAYLGAVCLVVGLLWARDKASVKRGR
jgi:hypothetical protein